MRADFAGVLWALKFGAVTNALLIVSLLSTPRAEGTVLAPALVLLSVSAFRCVFPNRYRGQVVLHDTVFSSIFWTRVLATLAEVGFIFLLSLLLRSSRIDGGGGVAVLSGSMVGLVVVAQGLVWRAILTQRAIWFFYEEICWFLIFVANTLASAVLIVGGAASETNGAMLLDWNLVFGAFYLPWQVFHLRALWREALPGAAPSGPRAKPWREGLRDARCRRARHTDAAAWGGVIGAVWMVAYWAAVIPVWVHQVALALSASPR